MTYQALLESARRVARGISEAPGAPGEPVALVFDHDTPSIVAILGSLLAGRPYVGLDPAVPASRHRHVLADLRPSVIVAQQHHLDAATDFDDRHTDVVAYEALLESEPLDVSLDRGPDGVAGIFYTSGTTGRPKGVIRTHRTILHRTMLDSVPGRFGPDDTFSLLYSTSFGTSVNDIFSAVLNGGTLAVRDVLASGVGSTVEWIANEPVTVLHAPVALMRRLVDAMEPGRVHPRLRMMIPSGRLYAADLRRFFGHIPDDAVIISRYASTETSLVCRLSIDATTPMDEGVVPVGRPVGDKRVRIERPDGRLAETDEVGEIVVSSRFLSPGYWNDEERTHTALTPDPVRPGFHLYRTGDHGRLRADGLLEFVGRKDDRVKIRGYRIEIDDIVAALHGVDGVKEAAVRVIEQAGTDHLVAYVVLADPSRTGPTDVRRRLEASLPAYMVPSFVVELPELPLTAAGKIDAAALPSVANHRPDLETGFVEPRDVTESAICDIWSDVLDITPIGVRDRFLDLGGDSLRAMQVIGRVLTRFGVDLPVRSLLDAGTVEAMAAAVVGSSSEVAGRGIERRPAGTQTPATAGQVAIWLAEQFGSGSGAYNMPKVIELEGRLEPSTLSRAIDIVVERQSALRTTFHLDGEFVVQRIESSPGDLLEIVEADDRDVDDLIAEVAGRPFDLAVDLPLRARLLRVSDDRHVLVVVSHHIVSDRESSQLLLTELAAAYRALSTGSPPDLPDLMIEYADYAVWQRGAVSADELQRQTDFWVERLESSGGSLDSLVAAGSPSGERASRLGFEADRAVLEALDRLAGTHGVSRFAALLAVVATAVGRAADRTHFTIGTPVTGRNRPELQPLIGYFANLVAVPLDLADGDLGSTTEQMGRSVADALAHADAPFDQIVARLAPERHRGRLPLVDLMVNYDRADSRAFDFGGVRAHRRREQLGPTRAPLNVNARSRDDGLSVDVVFDPGLVTRQRAERLVEGLREAFERLESEGKNTVEQSHATRSGA